MTDDPLDIQPTRRAFLIGAAATAFAAAVGWPVPASAAEIVTKKIVASIWITDITVSCDAIDITGPGDVSRRYRPDLLSIDMAGNCDRESVPSLLAEVGRTLRWEVGVAPDVFYRGDFVMTMFKTPDTHSAPYGEFKLASCGPFERVDEGGLDPETQVRAFVPGRMRLA